MFRRNGREVKCTGLLNQHTSFLMYQGFESLFFRNKGYIFLSKDKKKKKKDKKIKYIKIFLKRQSLFKILADIT
jgi:hypothetical protein